MIISRVSGPELLYSGGVRFRIWAPACARLRMALSGTCASSGTVVMDMEPLGDGWHELSEPTARVGTRYQFVLPDGLRVPDPASRFQPDDVHGPSEVIDPHAYRWQDQGWQGPPWHCAVIYELHIGAFTPEGTFAAAMARLDHLVALGVTAVELMPVADFPGRWNWGYDGVLWYAPDSTYGRPEDLKRFVDAAHARGLMVLLDVVYNHFGPEGNYLGRYAPAFFTDLHKTPWGAAINFDGVYSAEVRQFVIDNALYWLTEFHFDGLRIDAVHAIRDDSHPHLLDELAQRVHAQCPRAHLILENQANEAHRLVRDGQGAPVHFTAQWNDDLHHVLHVAATGERAGYYADYIGDLPKLARALAEGFSFQGEVMPYRGRPRGEASAALPPIAFVAFIQNHDRIGNRAFGDRLSKITAPAALRAITAVYMLLPQVPMLFMGEEWASSQPFLFFCDFPADLGAAVRAGRRREFSRFPEFQDENLQSQLPDPQSPDSFEASKLDWGEARAAAHRQWFEFHRRLLDVRRANIIPLLPCIEGCAGSATISSAGVVEVRWRIKHRGILCVILNLSDQSTAADPPEGGQVLWQEGEVTGDTLSAWFVRWTFFPSD